MRHGTTDSALRGQTALARYSARMAERERLELSGGEKETARTEAFSDGVFAIAITLLVLELKVPQVKDGESLLRELAAQWPSYLAFLTSFATIGIMWMNHHMLFNVIRRVDRELLVINLVLLLGVTVLPFPTALVAETLRQSGERVAGTVYAGTFVFISIAFHSLWRYVSSEKRCKPLLGVAYDGVVVRAIHKQYRFGPLYYVVTLLVTLWSTELGLALNLLLAFYWALPPTRAAHV